VPDGAGVPDPVQTSRERRPRWLTPGVGGVSAASFFSDAGHEMATSVLPGFVATLGGGAVALGAIEGVSDALIGVAKMAGGPLASDPRRRGRLASGGYLVTAVATASIGFATALWHVAILRAVAWVSRGVRSPARDALLVSLVPRSAYGRASGLERAGDNAGAVVGPLLAAALVGLVGVRHVLLLAVVPSLFAVVGITVAAREAGRTLHEPAARRRLSFQVGELRAAGLVRAFGPVAAFELGNVATTLLILRAAEQLEAGGRSATAAASAAILLYAGHNVAATLAALVGGRVIDATSPRVAFAAGAAVYVAGYAVFAAGPRSVLLLALGFALAGVGIGLAETAESTTVAVLLPDRLRGNGYGVLGLVQSFGALGASLVAGLLWSAASPGVAFGYAALWMAIAALGGVLVRPRTGA
jgi:MFS family permease